MSNDELFDVVNAQDEVIGVAPRSRVHAEGLRHRAAHVLVYDRAGQLFVQRRSFSKDNSPGLWDTSAAGHLASGEDYADAALRELEEELGVMPEAPLEALFRFDASAGTGQEFVWVYRAVVGSALRPDPTEIIDGRWCTPEALVDWRRRSPEAFTGTFLRILDALALGG